MIEIRNINKTFKLFHRPLDRFLEAVTGRQRHTPYHALKDISFHVEPGECWVCWAAMVRVNPRCSRCSPAC